MTLITDYKNILVATDLHDKDGMPAPNTAVAIAKKYQAKLTIISVAPKIPTYMGPGLNSMVSLKNRMLQEAQAKIDYIKSNLDFPAEYMTAYGVVSQEIIKAAKKIDADLIIIGSHGHQGVRKILGSTVSTVLNDAPCNVMVVRISKKTK
ncbi:MAG: universal stress protein [Gammaproteobacteria bacterium]|nr:universal stress protein [Gammaproteobacteria bacterium]